MLKVVLFFVNKFLRKGNLSAKKYLLEQIQLYLSTLPIQPFFTKFWLDLLRWLATGSKRVTSPINATYFQTKICKVKFRGYPTGLRQLKNHRAWLIAFSPNWFWIGELEMPHSFGFLSNSFSLHFITQKFHIEF